MKIGFIGLGVVGSATRAMVNKAGHTDVKCYDPRMGLLDDLDDREIIFISVPVPTDESGKQNRNILRESLSRCPKGSKVFIRSSVLPGSTAELREDFTDLSLYALPEFLTERSALQDAMTLPLIASEEASKILTSILKYKKFLTYEAESDCEMVKYMHNAFCAVKVGFFNSMFQVCRDYGLDYQRIVGGACEVTGFIETTHTMVPGPDGKRGFGGKCLPKDLFALSKFMENSGIKNGILQSALEENFFNRFEELF